MKVPYDPEEYESPADWFWIEVLGGCGCGNQERLSEMAWRLFTSWEKEGAGRISAYECLEYEVLAHWMGSLDLIEHGIGIGYPWPTKKGYEVLNQVRAFEGGVDGESG